MGEEGGGGFAHGGGGRRRFNCSFLSLAGAATSIVFVATKVLSRQACFCRDNTFVAMKMIFAAAPANDNCYALYVNE